MSFCRSDLQMIGNLDGSNLSTREAIRENGSGQLASFTAMRTKTRVFRHLKMLASMEFLQNLNRFQMKENL